MTRFMLVLLLVVPLITFAQENKETSKEASSNLRQYYSGKFGFYQPSDGLNNGLMFGIDGITEFLRYNFILTGAVDFYTKQTIGIFNKDPKPNVLQQAIVLLPLHVNAGMQLFNVPDADSRGYAGVGVGYYLYFYSVEYQTSSGGIIGGFGSQTDSKNGGNIFGSVFLRLLIGKVFVEPRFYLAAKKEDTVGGGHQFVINPSGFAVTFGFQYH
ncbi:MAG TPA: hypothetical protein VNL36_01425 [Bacteroidota bacterium]|nr:hypothetical protein [Bacteroidota bacterium]